MKLNLRVVLCLLILIVETTFLSAQTIVSTNYVLTPQYSTAGIITNGGFETGAPPDGHWYAWAKGCNSPTGWTVTASATNSVGGAQVRYAAWGKLVRGNNPPYPFIDNTNLWMYEDFTSSTTNTCDKTVLPYPGNVDSDDPTSLPGNTASLNGGNYLYFGNGTGSISGLPAPTFASPIKAYADNTNFTLTGAAPVTLNQSVSTIVGATYTLEFYVTGERNLSTEYYDGFFTLQIGTQKLHLTVPSLRQNHALPTQFYYQVKFTATATSTPISFINYCHTSGTGWGAGTTTEILLDDVRLNKVTSISGNVFDDGNGLLGDNTVNQTGTNGLPASGLYVSLVKDGVVVATVPVSATGTYTFDNVDVGNYSLVITTSSTGSTTPSLPANWVSTGENVGTAAGSDGTPNGILTAAALNITGTSANVTNANFGIDRLPETVNVAQSIPTPTGSSIAAGTITTPVSGSDPEGTPVGPSTIVITSLPTNGVMYYNGNIVTLGQSIIGFNPALLSFTGLQGGTTSTSFGYAYVDAAGKQDPSPATYTISWSRPLIVTFGAIEAKIEGKDLVVSWTTFVETDNDHFDIEVSKDGLSFTKIGSVNTKAPNGNSTQELKYDFTKSSTNASGLLGISILSFGLLLLCFRKRKSLVYIALFAFGIGLFGSSCGKNESALPSANTKVFVRIAQVDKDGTVDYSRIIQAIQE